MKFRENRAYSLTALSLPKEDFRKISSLRKNDIFIYNQQMFLKTGMNQAKCLPAVPDELPVQACS